MLILSVIVDLKGFRMSDLVRCLSCRGAKKVQKLGGILGDCNTCDGTGKVKASEIAKPVVVEKVETAKSVIDAVSQCVPTSISDKKQSIAKAKPFKKKDALKSVDSGSEPVIEDAKLDIKKAVFKRKAKSNQGG